MLASITLLAVFGHFFLAASPVTPRGLGETLLLVAVVLALWASGVVTEGLTSLIFFAAAILLKLAPPEVTLSGLSSSAFWMIFSGLILGAAIKSTGLSRRIAFHLAPYLVGRQITGIIGVTLFGLLLAVLMPSAMGRIVLIIPLLSDLAERLGLPEGSRARRGILLGGILGTTLPSTALLPANIPNNVLSGIYEGLFHQQITYSDYFLQHFPVLGLLKLVMIVGLLFVFYRDPSCRASKVAGRDIEAWSAAEKRLAIYLSVAVMLWMSDGMHHVSPAWVGLGAAIVCLLPSVGVLPDKTLQTINFEPLLYVSGVVGLGALISHSGLGVQLAAWLEAIMPLGVDAAFANFLSLCGVSTLLGMLTTLPGVPAVLTPLTQHFAERSGLSDALVLASQVVGFSTLVLPYQSPPVMAALQLAAIGRWEMTRLLLILAGFSILILWPLDYLWLMTLQ